MYWCCHGKIVKCLLWIYGFDTTTMNNWIECCFAQRSNLGKWLRMVDIGNRQLQYIIDYVGDIKYGRFRRGNGGNMTQKRGFINRIWYTSYGTSFSHKLFWQYKPKKKWFFCYINKKYFLASKCIFSLLSHNSKKNYKANQITQRLENLFISPLKHVIVVVAILSALVLYTYH